MKPKKAVATAARFSWLPMNRRVPTNRQMRPRINRGLPRLPRGATAWTPPRNRKVNPSAVATAPPSHQPIPGVARLTRYWTWSAMTWAMLVRLRIMARVGTSNFMFTLKAGRSLRARGNLRRRLGLVAVIVLWPNAVSKGSFALPVRARA